MVDMKESYTVVDKGLDNMVDMEESYMVVDTGLDNMVDMEESYTVVDTGLDNMVDMEESYTVVDTGLDNMVDMEESYTVVDTGLVNMVDMEDSPQTITTRTPNPELHKLRSDKGEAASDLLLRVGVKQGGCSGMSYVMDFEAKDKVKDDDMVMAYEQELGPDGFKLVVDPKSLLYLFGMSLDFSDALIGGGFQFINPNATDSCGCGKSFNV
eukprot:gene707-2134_t